ncbi:biotin transporter BioY [Elusimicrobiota bacterium]
MSEKESRWRYQKLNQYTARFLLAKRRKGMNIKGIVYIALFSVLTAAGAFVIVPVPYSPVPITLQTLFCILSGAILGRYKGMASQVVYLLLGFAGLPVFSRGGSGIGFLFGPTGGYLIGFVAAAYMCGWLEEKGKILPGLILGTIIIYLPGVVQLKLVTGLQWTKTMFIGLVPFLPGDILKVIVGLGIYNTLKKTGFIEYFK